MADAAVDRELREAFGRLELPLLLVDLTDLTVYAASRVGAEQLGVPSAEVVGRSVIDVLPEHERTEFILEALRDGVIDLYRTRPGADPSDAERDLHAPSGCLCVRAVELDGRRFGMFQLVPPARPAASPLGRYLGYEPVEMAIGTADASLTVTAVSSDAAEVLGVPPENIVGHRLLGAHVDDVHALLTADANRGDASVAMHIRLRNGDGGWTALCCVLTSLEGTTDRFFILMPDRHAHPASEPALAARVAELEHLILRLGAEIQAVTTLRGMGPAPDPRRVPELKSLSTRQWEVLSRLARGDRVSVIAADLFISPSTVRNHLAAIFERFGVHTQAELLQVLRERDALSA